MSDIMVRRFRSRRGATKFATASYTEVYDMHTEFGKTTLIGIHTPTTNRWQKYLGGFCQQFKRFRYKGASLSFVPVATLPADPLQVSYEAGEPGSDPRDLVNPIIHCGMRGQSMGGYLDEIFRSNIEARLTAIDVANVQDDDTNNLLEQMYYTALSAPNFRKSHPQTGFRKNGLHPMVYTINMNEPRNYAADPDVSLPRTAVPTIGTGTQFINGTASDPSWDDNENGDVAWAFSIQPTLTDSIKVAPQFFTNKLVNLGWLDTLQNYAYSGDNESPAIPEVRLTTLPKVYMYFVMLPPAYKTEMYFRVVVRHFFEFAGFRSLVGPFSQIGVYTHAYDGEIQNDPVNSVATMDVINGEASLLSDGAI